MKPGVKDQIELLKRVRAVLAGQPPEIVGAALAEMMATLIAGHAPPLRRTQRDMLVKLIDELTPIIVAQLIATGKAPANWQDDDE
jgi:hypothetical protein